MDITQEEIFAIVGDLYIKNIAFEKLMVESQQTNDKLSAQLKEFINKEAEKKVKGDCK